MSRQSTAKKAITILVNKDQGYKEPNKTERLNILIAFAKKNKVIYGKAFDVIKVCGSEIDLEDLKEVENNLDRITLCEIKSTAKKSVDKDFKKYFFGITTAELLVAQNLKQSFKFVFVNTLNENVVELPLKDVFERAKGIYPTWSIQF